MVELLTGGFRDWTAGKDIEIKNGVISFTGTGGGSLEIVDKLPTENIKDDTIYFLKDENDPQVITAYIHTKDGWLPVAQGIPDTILQTIQEIYDNLADLENNKADKDEFAPISITELTEWFG